MGEFIHSGEYVLSHPAPNVALLALHGEHDLYTMRTSNLAATMRTLVDTHALVVVDLSELQFMDSSVLGALVQMYKRAKESGHRVRIQVGEAVYLRQMLEMAGLHDLFQMGLGRDASLLLDDAIPPEPPEQPCADA